MSALAWPRACAILARLYFKQTFRSKVLWFMALIVSLPGIVAIALVEQEPSEAWVASMGTAISLLALVPPILAGGVVADELDDQTYTYLWSRPLPRWTVLVGKLAGATPIVAAIVVGSGAVGWSAADSEGLVTSEQLTRATLALGVGSIVACAVAAGLGTLVVRHPIVAGIVYMLLLDLPIAQVPFSLRHLSIAFHVGELAGIGDVGVAPWESLTWLLGIGALWLSIGLWRVGKLEGMAKG